MPSGHWPGQFSFTREEFSEPQLSEGDLTQYREHLLIIIPHSELRPYSPHEKLVPYFRYHSCSIKCQMLVFHTCSNRFPYPYSHPKMVVWPETSLEGHLNRDHGCGIIHVQRQQCAQLGYPLAGTKCIWPGTWFQCQPTTYQCLEASSDSVYKLSNGDWIIHTCILHSCLKT